MRMTLFVLCLAAASLVRAQEADLISADRPGLADGSTTVRRGAFQVELGLERDDESTSRILTTPLLLRYGLTEALELRVETSGWERTTAGGRADSRFAPLAAGIKYRFLNEPSAGIIASIGEHASGDVLLTADFDLGEKWSINPNVGIVSENDGRRMTSGFGALTIQRNLTEKANVFIDGAADSSSLLLDAGGAWILGRDTQLDVSIGWSAHSEGPNVFWSAGISRRF